MKGIIFREFIGMVESRFSLETADAIITASDLRTSGAYTNVGTYPHEEMVQLVTHLSALTRIPVSDLLSAFGRHLFKRFAHIHPDYVTSQVNAFDLLRVLDGHIHVEVRKLYAEVELPSFEHIERSDGSMIFVYRSVRALADFAEGMLRGCIDHFKEPMQVDRYDLPGSNGTHTEFTITPTTHAAAG